MLPRDLPACVVSIRVASLPPAEGELRPHRACRSRTSRLVTDWCEQMERLFNEAESPAGGGGDDGEVQGPRSELEHWRSRMGKLNSIIEQLRGEQCRMVLAVLQVR
jgi:hypothetical protein